MFNPGSTGSAGSPAAVDLDGASRPAARITVGVVENDRLLREGLVALLNTVEEFHCIGAWNLAHEAASAIEALSPDVLLLDIRQLQPGGIAFCLLLPSISPATRILLTMSCPEDPLMDMAGGPLSTHPGALAMLTDEHFGVCGIVYKNRGFGWTAERIREAYARGRTPDRSPPAESAGIESSSISTEAEHVQPQSGSLTFREREVVRLIGQGRSNKDVARELKLAYSTVKNYVSSILTKLELDGRTQIALVAQQWSGESRVHGDRNLW